MESLHLKPTTQSASDRHGDQDELPSRALSLCPTHAVVMKVMQLIILKCPVHTLVSHDHIIGHVHAYTCTSVVTHVHVCVYE